MKCHLSVSDDPELRIVCGVKLVTPEVGVAYESDLRMLRDVLELLGPNKCSKCVKKWEADRPKGIYYSAVMETKTQPATEGR